MLCMYKCGKNVTCNFGEVSFTEELYIESKGFRECCEILSSKKWCIVNWYLHNLNDIILRYTRRDKKEKEQRRIRELHQSETFEKTRIAVRAQRIPERDGSKYCICVLSLKTPKMLIAGLTFFFTFLYVNIFFARSLDSYLFLHRCDNVSA